MAKKKVQTRKFHASILVEKHYDGALYVAILGVGGLETRGTGISVAQAISKALHKAGQEVDYSVEEGEGSGEARDPRGGWQAAHASGSFKD